MKTILKVAAGVVAGFLALIVVIAVVAGAAVTEVEPPAKVADRTSTPSTSKSTTSKPSTPSASTGEQNALEAAESYLDGMPFSKKGLMRQLTSDVADGYSEADASYAVAHVDADWNEQAARAAKNYLESMPFSRERLIEQLTSDVADGYTQAQAEYGVAAAYR